MTSCRFPVYPESFGALLSIIKPEFVKRSCVFSLLFQSQAKWSLQTHPHIRWAREVESWDQCWAFHSPFRALPVAATAFKTQQGPEGPTIVPVWNQG